MIKWPITYEDYNGSQVTEDFYFNLNKAELTAMLFDANGAYTEYIQRLINERNLKQLGSEFRNIILNSYGQKSDDGKVFRKNQQIREDFENSEAYSVLFMELISDSDKASKFITGILPKELQNQAAIPNALEAV